MCVCVWRHNCWPCGKASVSQTPLWSSSSLSFTTHFCPRGTRSYSGAARYTHTHTHTQPHCCGMLMAFTVTHTQACVCVCRSLKTPVKCSQYWWSRRWGRWCHLSQTALLWHWSVALATVVWICCWIFIRRRLTSVEAWRQQCNHSSVCVCVCGNRIKKDLCILYTFICYTI